MVVNYASDKSGAEKVVADITAKGGRAVAVKADVSKAAEAQGVVHAAVKNYGRLDVLVNNSGVYEFAPIDDFTEESERVSAEKALEYMDLTPGTPMRDVEVDTVFVGSCTNGRIEDLRLAAEVVKGRRVAPDTRLLVVPGSVRVRLQAEAEGLDKVFTEAGGEWRGAGCSMCLGMNPDQLAPGERSASTSNRNFEGRQGKGGRTHLVSVPVAAATAVAGRLASPADLPPLSS